MRNCNVSDEAMKCFLGVKYELSVEKIDLSENFSFVTNASVEILSNCKGLTCLASLNLADNSISDEGIGCLSRSMAFCKLRELVAYGNTGVTSHSLLALAESEWVRGLVHLDLHATSISDEGLSVYLKSENSTSLERLDLSMSWKRVTDFSLASLAESRFCSRLRVLNLEDCSITDQGVVELSQSENVAALEDLNLSNSIKQMNNIITDLSLREMAQSKAFKSLKILQLKATKVTSEGVKALVGSDMFEAV